MIGVVFNTNGPLPHCWNVHSYCFYCPIETLDRTIQNHGEHYFVLAISSMVKTQTHTVIKLIKTWFTPFSVYCCYYQTILFVSSLSISPHFCLHVCVCVAVCCCEGQRLLLSIFLYHFPFNFWKNVSTIPETHCFNYTGWPENAEDVSVCPLTINHGQLD